MPSQTSYSLSGAAALALTLAPTLVSAHGFIVSPTPRMPGDLMKSACGEQVYNNQLSDNYGNIQGELQIAATQTDYNENPCDIWLCKGFKLEDSSSVQSFTRGQKIDMEVEIRAPHTGHANVSIVDTATNSIVQGAGNLISWDDYASNSSPIPDSQTSFSITIPEDLEGCQTAGECVIQWFWDAPDIDQTYESCVDFTVSGSGSGGSQGEGEGDVPTTTTTPPVGSSGTPTPSAAPYVTIPSGMYTSVLPSALPTGTAAAGAALPTQVMTEGTTVGDLADWINYMMSGFKTKAQRHARDFAAAAAAARA